jgi:DNA polymerase sigma
LPWSDLDLLIRSRSNDKLLEIDEVLIQIDQRLRRESKMFAEVKYIHGATTPVIKVTCTEQYFSKKIDITFQDEKHTGPSCVELVQKYMESYPALEYLVLPLKQLMQITQLNDPYQGGLTSYGLVLMVVAYLQFKKSRGLSIELTEPNLGYLLLDFIYYYSSMDLTQFQISPAKSVKLDLNLPIIIQSQTSNHTSVITDPLLSTNNVAKSFLKHIIFRV